MESKIKKELIEYLFNQAERISGYILKWEGNEKNMKILDVALKKLEKRGASEFSRKEKVMISEWANEFGMQASKVPMTLAILEKLYGGEFEVEQDSNLAMFIYTHKFSDPIKIKWKKKK